MKKRNDDMFPILALGGTAAVVAWMWSSRASAQSLAQPTESVLPSPQTQPRPSPRAQEQAREQVQAGAEDRQKAEETADRRLAEAEAATERLRLADQEAEDKRKEAQRAEDAQKEAKEREAAAATARAREARKVAKAKTEDSQKAVLAAQTATAKEAALRLREYLLRTDSNWGWKGKRSPEVREAQRLMGMAEAQQDGIMGGRTRAEMRKHGVTAPPPSQRRVT